MKKIVKDSKGITLVALVITIVVIMILAGITLNTTVGKNGLITIMRETEQNQTLAQEEGQAKLDELKQDDEYTEDGVKVVADTDAPKINSVKVTDRTKYSITVKADVTETKSGIAVIRYKIGDGDWQTDSTNSRATTYTFTGLEEATIYEITVEATDVENHKSTAIISSKTYSISLNEAQKDIMVSKTVNTPILIGEDRVVIPSGFKIAYDSATEVSGGIVIEDKDGNQFVWIPVESIADYKRAAYSINTSTGTIDTTTKSEKINSADTTYYYVESMPSDEKASVESYKGYYIGRYEAGDKESTASQTMRVSGATVSNTVTVKKSQVPYNWVTKTQSQTLAEGMATKQGYKAKTKLCSSYAWDTAIAFIQTKATNYGSDSKEGNYNDLGLTSYKDIKGASKTKAASESVLIPTGQTTPVCNIYDMGGNVWEWTTEKTSSTSLICTRRGGAYVGRHSGEGSPAGYRLGGPDQAQSYHGFRPALFM